MNLQRVITTKVSAITKHPSFKNWLKGKKLKDGNFIAINNSFLFREDLKTTKSAKYIVVKYDTEESFSEIFIAENLDIKKPEFLLLQDSKEKTSINEAVEEEVNNLGQIVFALIGSVQDNVVQIENFNKLDFSEVVWDAKINKPIKIENSKIVIQNPYNEQALWDAVVEFCNHQNIKVDEDAKGQFGAILEKMQTNAEAMLELPAIEKKDFKGILDDIIAALHGRRKDYKKALSVCKGRQEIDKDAFNELLRISYNFSNDVIPLLNLTIGICDLKPIIFWSTIREHYFLSESIRNLPWTPSFKKGNLESYKNMVGNARNSTFHNLFPFQTALRFSLPPGALANTELRFFAEFANKKAGNKFTYQDKELVDLFLDFTRAKQRFVPVNFWEKNVDVMDKVIDLFEATNDVLKELYRITKVK